MLTAKVGETIINSFSNSYDRYMLKKWSDKNILKCPVCNGTYEYCHGEVVSPYFRHKEKDCSGYFSEPETEEHKKGKEILYNWIKDQDGVINCQLEAWIPETKQRPDIYFEYNGKKYVIEYQCTPIASEYLHRKELYRLAGINDMWILGTEKYSIDYAEDTNRAVYLSSRYKTIEKELQNEEKLFYLDVRSESLLSNHLHKSISIIDVSEDEIHKHIFYDKTRFIELPYYFNVLSDFSHFPIERHIFNGFIDLKEGVALSFNETETEIKTSYEKHRQFLTGKWHKKAIKSISEQINREINNSDYTLYMSNSTNNLCKIEFSGKYVFFVKASQIDFCRDWGYKQKYNRYENIESFLPSSETWYREWEGDDVYTFIKHKIKEVITKDELKIKQEKERIDKELKINQEVFGDFLEKDIFLIHQGRQDVPESTRFKMLKDFYISDEYMRKQFIKELKFLKRKNADKFIFMIPKYHSHFNNLGFSSYIRVWEFNDLMIKVFQSFGFKNVKFIDDSTTN